MKFVVSTLFTVLLVQVSEPSIAPSVSEPSITPTVSEPSIVPSVSGSSIAPSELELEAKPGQFPYQVSIESSSIPLIDYRHDCGGSIVNKDYILTAASCVGGLLGNVFKYRVKAGMHYLDKDDENVQVVEVAKTILHEGFPTLLILGDQSWQHDIAILKLVSPLTMNERVQPIALPVQNSVPYDDVVISGWSTASERLYINLATELRYSKVSVVEYSDCDTMVKKLEKILYKTMICTKPVGATCSGDLGGPLVTINTTTQVGIVSSGYFPCNMPGAPTVYTRVSSYVSWINKNIQLL